MCFVVFVCLCCLFVCVACLLLSLVCVVCVLLFVFVDVAFVFYVMSFLCLAFLLLCVSLLRAFCVACCKCLCLCFDWHLQSLICALCNCEWIYARVLLLCVGLFVHVRVLMSLLC